MSEQYPREPVTVTDKRRIDPETGAVRAGVSEAAAPRAAPSGPAPEAPGADVSAPEAPGADQSDQVAELTADLQRVQADFANYRKRTMRDQQAAAERAKASVVTQLLGILDDLDRARCHGDLASGPLKSFADNLTSVLSGLGLAAFGAEGDDFDPMLHEAVQHEGGDSEGARPVIGTVMRQGYKLGEQVLRHAMVGVVDTGPDEGEPSATETADAPDNAANSDEQNAES